MLLTKPSSQLNMGYSPFLKVIYIVIVGPWFCF